MDANNFNRKSSEIPTKNNGNNEEDASILDEYFEALRVFENGIVEKNKKSKILDKTDLNQDNQDKRIIKLLGFVERPQLETCDTFLLDSRLVPVKKDKGSRGNHYGFQGVEKIKTEEFDSNQLENPPELDSDISSESQEEESQSQCKHCILF